MGTRFRISGARPAGLPRARLPRAALFAAALWGAAALAMSGCSSGSGAKADPPAISEADVTSQVQQYAQDVVDLIGDPDLELPATATSSAPCQPRGSTAKGAFSVRGSYSVPVAAERQQAALGRIREQWRQHGFTITADSSPGAGGTGALAATNPADGYRVELTGGPDALALTVSSSCNRAPTR
jgi:hypothetical protein